MAQVTRTTNDIIVNALYLLGELGVGETPDAFMLSTGLDIVNELLDKFSADSIYIPFLTTLSFTMVPGQAQYSISDIVAGADIRADRLVDLVFANFTVGTTIVYPLRIVNKATYYNNIVLTNLIARPGIIFMDKQSTESFINVYPAPDQSYPCTIQVKSMIDKLEPYEDISELPPYYYGFMKYAVARKFLAYYPSGNWPQTNEDEYQDYFSNLKNANETDLTIRPSATLNIRRPFYWQSILAYF
jgi:hypothetical protein